MSEPEEALSRTEVSENTSGVVLGYWDHERTPTLIQDLEQSVNLVELKCKKLLKELAHYKKYLEKPGEIDFHLTVFKKKSKKSKNSVFFSGSEPEIAFRKNCINFQKIKQILEQKFQEKLENINQELQEAADKIGLKDSIILFPTDFLKNSLEQLKYFEPQEGSEEDEVDVEEEEEGDIRDKFIKLSTLKNKTRSDSVIADNAEDPDFSKITKNQLELYQKLSRLSMKKCSKKLNRKSKIRRKKIKFFLRRKAQKYHEGFRTSRTSRNELQKPRPPTKARKIKNKIAVRLKSRSRSLRDSDSTEHFRDSKINQSLVDTAVKSRDKASGKEHGIESSPNLGAALRKVMPFTVCTSTSRSYNLGLNMQQLLSLPKYGRKAKVRISTSEKMHRRSSRTNNEESTSGPAEVKKRHRTPWTQSQTKSNDLGTDQRRDAWVSEVVTSSNCRKVQSKIAGQSPNSVFKFHKSTTSQFPNGQKMIQSESKTAYAVGSKIMVSDCHRTDIFEIEKTNCYKNAAGDGKNNNKYAELTMEWAKVYSSFLKIYRKYTHIKEKVSGSDLANANEELKSLEKDVDYSIEKYKEFLQFYTKFLHLNHRLKSLKIACETKTFEPVTSFSTNCQRKIWSYKPTHSMAMKGALREVQALQTKINLVKD